MKHPSLVLVTSNQFPGLEQLCEQLKNTFSFVAVVSEGNSHPIEEKITSVEMADLVVFFYPTAAQSDERAALAMIRAKVEKPAILLGCDTIDETTAKCMMQSTNKKNSIRMIYGTSDFIVAAKRITKEYDDITKKLLSTA